MESQEQAYMVQIEHLKSEVTDRGQGHTEGQVLMDGTGSDKVVDLLLAYFLASL